MSNALLCVRPLLTQKLGSSFGQSSLHGRHISSAVLRLSQWPSNKCYLCRTFRYFWQVSARFCTFSYGGFSKTWLATFSLLEFAFTLDSSTTHSPPRLWRHCIKNYCWRRRQDKNWTPLIYSLIQLATRSCLDSAHSTLRCNPPPAFGAILLCTSKLPTHTSPKEEDFSSKHTRDWWKKGLVWLHPNLLQVSR